MMFGEAIGAVADLPELSGELTGGSDRRRGRPGGDTVLELDGAGATGEGVEPGIEDVSLALHAGEVLGVAGVDGNGQRALAEGISGQRRLTHGEVKLFGAPVGRMSVAARETLGLRYVTDDRLGEGIVSSLSVSLNLVLKRVGRPPFWRHGQIQKREIDRQARAFIDRFEIRTPGPETRAGTLSGGNVQKLVLARELSFSAKAVVFHKPTYGLDLKTTRTVRQLIRDLADDGRAALVISTDLDELLEVADRILVLSRGRIVGSVENGPDAAERIGALMIGEDPRAAERGAAA
jgi:simple sugar transport system ATP-binding protein